MMDGTEMEIPQRNERIFRMGGLMGCGFSWCMGKSDGKWLGRSGIRDQCYILVYIIKGVGVYEDTRGNAFEIGPGCLYQRFPGVEHTNLFQSSEEFAECYLIFPPQMFELLQSTRMVSLSVPNYQIGLNELIYAQFSRIYERLNSCPENQLHEVLAEMHMLLVNLLMRANQANKADHFVENASTLLLADKGCKRPLEDIAQELGVSYSKFRKDFKMAVGMSPGTYRQGRRMELAQQMLTESIAIKNVALKLGYPDVYSFSKQFKLQTDMTPKQFALSRR